jgi:uncharacterized membrane protein YfcA
MEYVLAAVLGFTGGVVGGTLGVGGGIVFVPALVLAFDEPQLRAEATSLLAIFPMAVVGAWRQRSLGNVRLRDALVIGALSPIGVLTGVVLSNAVSPRLLEVAFAILVLLVAAQLARRVIGASPQVGSG